MEKFKVVPEVFDRLIATVDAMAERLGDPPIKRSTLTITLTGRVPVTIIKHDWPIVASANSNMEGRFEEENPGIYQAAHKLMVRQHSDGRAIVYGIFILAMRIPEPDWKNLDLRGGSLVDADGDIVKAIEVVGATLEQRIQTETQVAAPFGTGTFPRLIHECIAHLPAEELK